MRTLSELQSIYNTVQQKILKECWKDLDSLTKLCVDKVNDPTLKEKFMNNIQSKVNTYLDKYNLTNEEKELFRKQSISWGLESSNVKETIIKNKLDKK